MHQLLFSRQGPVHLPISDARLVRAFQEIIVGHVQINVLAAYPAIQLGDSPELVPLRVVQSLVIGMRRRGTHIARIRAVVLQTAHSRLFQEGLYLPEIFFAPLGAQTGRAAEGHAAPLSGFRVDHVHLVADPPAGQQRVASQFDALALSIFHQFAEFLQVLFADVFRIRSRTEAENDHFISRFGTLVDGGAHGLRVAACEMHEDRVFRGPGSDGPLQAFLKQPFSLAVITVERHFIHHEAGECLSRVNALVRSYRRSHFQDARCLQQIVAL